MVDYANLIATNKARWLAAKMTRGPEFTAVAKRLLAAKARYQTISMKTGVPWFIIAVIHERESAQNWNSNLAQGDPWNRVSTHVPAGRGPFASWDAAAIDALDNCAPFASRWKDWSSGGGLTLLELYNGLGYANKGLPSPYIWSGTDQYRSGKYVADGVFDPNTVDKQLGCAGMIVAMMALDPSIVFGARPTVPVPLPAPAPKTPGVRNTATSAAVIGTILAAFEAPSIKSSIAFVVIGIAIAVAIHFLWPKKTQ